MYSPKGLAGHLIQRVKSHWTTSAVVWWSQRKDIMCGRSVILMMVLALTSPVDAGIRTESEATVKTPIHLSYSRLQSGG
ncbi:hypothetical protein Pcinc_030887 [Petrolisthes cinctipes]|uniref:Uncharacterized protein n=1 Tax=Petrolisthes cinctipes TaxID=88211 RepID=A0AAE1EX81_PETCI|nr:hypothetical protein Pcinc_030887 [Petrolisthes cinctipes]